jgi:hypothetical protein
MAKNSLQEIIDRVNRFRKSHPTEETILIMGGEGNSRALEWEISLGPNVLIIEHYIRDSKPTKRKD